MTDRIAVSLVDTSESDDSSESMYIQFQQIADIMLVMNIIIRNVKRKETRKVYQICRKTQNRILEKFVDQYKNNTTFQQIK